MAEDFAKLSKIQFWKWKKQDEQWGTMLSELRTAMAMAQRQVGTRERERFIPSHNIIKICYQNHCALQMLDSRSNMVITDLLPGAPLMFLLAILAAHPVYISV